MKVKQISAKKPRKPEMVTKTPVSVAVSRLSDLRFRFVQLGVQYVILKITFNGEKCKGDVCYRLPNSEALYKRKRCIDVLGQPYSSPMAV